MRKTKIIPFFLIVSGITLILSNSQFHIPFLDLLGYLTIIAGLCFIRQKKKTYVILYGLLYISIFVIDLVIDYNIAIKGIDGYIVSFNEYLSHNFNYVTILLLLCFITIPLIVNSIKYVNTIQ